MAATTESEIKEQFWKSMSASPFVMLELDNAPHSAAPMTAQLDKDAHSAIWFFTARDNALAHMGPATATFAAKDHTLFARFSGQLIEEQSRSVLEKHWSSAVAAWFPEGKEFPAPPADAHGARKRLDLERRDGRTDGEQDAAGHERTRGGEGPPTPTLRCKQLGQRQTHIDVAACCIRVGTHLVGGIDQSLSIGAIETG